MKNLNFHKKIQRNIWKHIFDKFKNNIKEKVLNQNLNGELISIFDEMKKSIIGNINYNFNKNYFITSINFIFDKDQLFNSIYESIKKADPFNAEKIKSLKHHLNDGFAQIFEKNLMKRPTNTICLLKKSINSFGIKGHITDITGKESFGGDNFSLIDCRKINGILISNEVIDKTWKFNENWFNFGKDRFEKFINLEIRQWIFQLQ